MHLKIFWLQVIEVHLKVTEETRTKLSQIIRFQLDLLQTGSGDSSDIGQALSFSLFALLVCSHCMQILSTWEASYIATQAERELFLLVSIYRSQGRFQRAWSEWRVNPRKNDGGGQELIGGSTTCSTRGAVLAGKGQ